MNKEETVRKLAEKVDGKVYEHYSGKCMFGNTCIGVVCKDMNKCLLVAGRLKLENAKTDNMGLDYIVYFPDIKSSIKENEE